jgi:hypothetical protein
MDARPLPTAADACGSLITPRGAFARVFNLRTIAAVFYFCLIVVISRRVIDLQHQGVEVWFVDSLRFLRQSLISGLVLLAAIALADAAAVRGRLTRRPAIFLGCAAVLAGSAIAVLLRLWVYGSMPATPATAAYIFTLWTTWSMLGGLAYGLFYLTREEEYEQIQLCDAERSQAALGAQMVQAQLSALQAQIEPHFLFNTLANVRRLYETVPTRGRDMLTHLIDYLRAALPTMRSGNSTLGRELELARAFLSILQMRMGERLEYSIGADPGLLDLPMPPLVLPTLVENAIKHGLAPLPEGGRIVVHARRSGDQIEIDVVDNGVGFCATAGSGVGLANTRSRLSALYGSRASLDLTAGRPRGVVATLRLPMPEPRGVEVPAEVAA